MDVHAIEYYSTYSEPGPQGHFHEVIALHNEPLLDWIEIRKISQDFPRGWYELARLSREDRIEFTREFWLTKLPFSPRLNQFLTQFFSSLDDVGIFLTQQKYDDPFISHFVYSLKDNNGFFHGYSPAKENEIIDLQKDFSKYILPPDYFAFLQIHNGFAKLTDTGVIPSSKMKESYETFQKMFSEHDRPISTSDGTPVNPLSLIPFYESFGMPFFQCFWGEWYPEQEMGNVYFSPLAKTISICNQPEECEETLAFKTYSDWLMFYLEKID